MWGRSARRSTAVAAVGAVLLAVAVAVVQGVVGRGLDGFSWPIVTIIVILSIMWVMGVAAFKALGARRQSTPAVGAVPAGDSIDVVQQIPASESSPRSVEPDSRVTYRPALGQSALVAAFFSV